MEQIIEKVELEKRIIELESKIEHLDYLLDGVLFREKLKESLEYFKENAQHLKELNEKAGYKLLERDKKLDYINNGLDRIWYKITQWFKTGMKIN